MPGKSGHRRGKYSSQSKKRKFRPTHAAVAAQQPPVAQARETALPPGKSVPLAPVSTPKAKQPAINYPYLATELRRIGILTGIMLIILIVLTLVLS